MITKTPLSSFGNSGTDNRSDSKLIALEYVDDVALLSDDPNKLQVFFDYLDDSGVWDVLHLENVKC